MHQPTSLASKIISICKITTLGFSPAKHFCRDFCIFKVRLNFAVGLEGCMVTCVTM